MEWLALGLAFLAPSVAAMVGWVLTRKIREVHLLVNDRLDRALHEIESLKAALIQEKEKNE